MLGSEEGLISAMLATLIHRRKIVYAMCIVLVFLTICCIVYYFTDHVLKTILFVLTFNGNGSSGSKFDLLVAISHSSYVTLKPLFGK